MPHGAGAIEKDISILTQIEGMMVITDDADAFIHSFAIGYLLCIKHYAASWGYSDKINKQTDVAPVVSLWSRRQTLIKADDTAE